MINIAKKLEAVKNIIPKEVTLVAVSKYFPVTKIEEAYLLGQRIFAESRVQELLKKREALERLEFNDIKWHFIGNLQRNKVKDIVSFIDLIHSVSSLRLLNEIGKEAQKVNRVVDCLLEIKIATLDKDSGFSINELEALLEKRLITKEEFIPSNIRIRGVMGMSSFTSDQEIIKEEFLSLRKCFERLKRVYPTADTLSMGMSGDFKIAIECGSNMIRIGSLIFED